jgi:hypothetical protein
MFMVLALAAAVPILLEKSTEWDEVYAAAARRLIHGEDLYPRDTNFTYPPFMAIVAVGIESVGPRAGRWLWLAINLLAATLAVRAAWRASGGNGWPKTRADDLVVLVGLFCGLRYILNGFAHLQTDIVIAALMLLGCERITRQKSMAAGILWGLATAIKGPALLLIGYLIYKRRVAASIAMAATIMMASLSTDLFYPAPTGSLWVQRWFQIQSAVLSNAEQYPGVWASTIENNQSLAGLVGRATVGVWQSRGSEFLTGVADQPRYSATDVKRILLAIELLLGVVSLGAFLIASGRQENSHRRIATECGIVLTLIVLVSPMSSKPHFISMILPGWLLARSAVIHQKPTSAGMLALALLGLNIGWNFFGNQIEFFALWTGAMTLGTIALWIGLVHMLCRPDSDGKDRQANPPSDFTNGPTSLTQPRAA